MKSNVGFGKLPVSTSTLKGNFSNLVANRMVEMLVAGAHQGSTK